MSKALRTRAGDLGSGAADFPIAWLVAAFTIAQLGDLLTALLVARELNPIAASLISQPVLAFALKVGLIAFVVAIAEIVARNRPLLARAVLLFGAIAGFLGALSNTHLTPFLTT